MTDQNDQGSKDSGDPKVIPLFPDQAVDHGRLPVASDMREAALLQTMEQILDEAQPAAPSRQMQDDRPRAPAPGHRNAMACPQCDQFTWRMNQHCLHCGTDLVEYAQRQAYRRHRRRLRIARGCILLSWLVAIGCFVIATFYARYLWPQTRHGLYLASILLAGINILVSMILFRPDDPR